MTLEVGQSVLESEKIESIIRLPAWLVESMLKPSHVMSSRSVKPGGDAGLSRMGDYTAVMTVRELGRYWDLHPLS
ncbi:MAG: hypothetical protein Q8R76_10420 [Candidatus Omnitrophota bacterium]|nr:hypothetical protein [Candidatus Omnitrophota bacterium]